MRFLPSLLLLAPAVTSMTLPALEGMALSIAHAEHTPRADTAATTIELAPRANTRAINIIYRSYTRKSYYENQWFFYETPVGKSAICRPADQTIAKFGPYIGYAEPRWPAGTFPVRPFGMDCEYKNNGQNPGALWCKGRSGPIGCKEEDRLASRNGQWCQSDVWQLPYVYCEW